MEWQERAECLPVGWVGGGEDGLGFDGGVIGMLVCSAMRVGRARRVEVKTRCESIKTATMWLHASSSLLAESCRAHN